MTDDDPTLSPADVAARLGNVSASFVYEEIARGRLRAHRFGKGKGILRISERQYRDYLLSHITPEVTCQSDASKAAASRPNTKTSSETSRELADLLTPAAKPKNGSRRSTATRRPVSWDTRNDDYSGKH
jgi:excisionase family DNA binding protein